MTLASLYKLPALVFVAAILSNMAFASAQSNTAAAELQGILDTASAQDDLVGVVLSVETPEWQFTGSSGYADRDAGTAIQPGDAFRIGSITKVFTATVVLQLAEEGILNLDDPLSKWLPDVASQLPNGEQITLRHLLSHASGLHDYAVDEQFLGQLLADPYQDVIPQQVIDFVAEAGEPAFAPGDYDHAQYSSTDYTVLGLVIEAATNASLVDAFHSRIFEPLGLEHTYLEGFEDSSADIIHGYSFILSPSGLDTSGWNTSAAWAAGGLVSTAEDLMTFAHALVHGSLFQMPSTLDEMLTFVGADEYGLGVERIGSAAWGHSGQIFGFSSLFAYVPEADAIVILLANSDEMNAGSFAQVKNATIDTLLR